MNKSIQVRFKFCISDKQINKNIIISILFWYCFNPKPSSLETYIFLFIFDEIFGKLVNKIIGKY
ncbi:hypothetical protein BpHYR1_007917 [Brachionus plicatilis]|uniref:Uncharacterized protein n=1 Tax=Brachionus plicatilis TaxID=10195 RepID=A0A3M7T9U6_BRAPC|nr:hypothetical protein BpHYR1_007917 [Brachionus plicatilis]